MSMDGVNHNLGKIGALLWGGFTFLGNIITVENLQMMSLGAGALSGLALAIYYGVKALEKMISIYKNWKRNR